MQPNGQPLLVTDGIQRLRYRLSLNDPVFVQRDTTYRIGVDAGVTSYCLSLAIGYGSKFRAAISLDFDRNFNNTKAIADETRW